MNISCSAVPCPVILNSTCVFYEAGVLLYTGINSGDNLQTALQKIDAKFQDAGLGYIFQNGIIQAVPGDPVKLGGQLNQNTLITSGGFTFGLTGTIEASSFITTGGTSSEFVKGDGSLDGTTYQTAGNYITGLTGDGTASGPGVAAFTLTNTGVIASTYGSNSQVPVITVDSKGRITNVTNTLINYPDQLILISGDATGVGYGNSGVSLTLNTVNTGVFNSITPLKFSVNGKGLVTGASPLTNLDIFTLIGYTPVPTTRTLTINGQTYDLSANRSWTLPTGGTVSSVSVTAGTGISASVSNPTTTPNITISNTAPDQIVTLTPGTGIGVTGTYPNFTITNTSPSLGGTVTSVGLSMPAAFTVTNSPVTSSGTLTVTGAGTASQYVRGDGQLATLPSSPSGGGASIGYYLNGSIPSSVPGYEQLSRNPVFGPGTNYSTSTDGLIAQFLTDVGDPNLLNIPGGSWLVDLYFNASSAGGTPNFYIELYKYDGAIFTFIASNSATPEFITNGTSVDLYTTSLAVPTTTLALTDRLAIRVYVACDTRTITLHTENGNLSQVITTFSTGISALNGLTSQVQFLATGTTGTDFNINSATATHTFNLPVASATNTGKLSNTDWSNFNTAYTNRITSLTTTGSSGASTLISNILNIPTYTLSGLGGVPTSRTLTINGTAFDLSADRSWSVGTVTSVAALTLGTTGTDLSSSVATGTTTPVITLNVPTASSTNRGALSSTDWTTFNSKQNAITLTTSGTSGASTLVGSTLNIPQYQGVLTNPITGTGVGTSSGGRVPYFTGTTTQVGSDNLWWDNTNARLGIGTTTPANTLDVNGTARVQGNATVALNQNGATELHVSNTINSAASQTLIRISSSTGSGLIGRYSASSTPYKTLLANNTFFYSAGVSDISFLNDYALGSIKFATGGVSTPQITLFNTGNLAINTTTDAGFRLDVNGTARVQGTITSLVPNGTNSLNLTNAAADSTFINVISSTWSRTTFSSQSASGILYANPQATTQGGVAFPTSIGLVTSTSGLDVAIGTVNGSGGGVNYYGSANGSKGGHRWFHNNVEQMRLQTSGNLLINTTTDAGFRLDVNGTARVQNNLTIGNGFFAGGYFLTFANSLPAAGTRATIDFGQNSGIVDRRKFAGGNDHTLSFLVSLGGSATELLTIQAHNGSVATYNVGINNTNPNASAVLDVTSTTQGFLPPRMTTAQRDLIATPAAGLVIYNTSTNKHQGYNGTTWNDFY